MMPVPLSYFSPVVGGLPGAAALGMEPTYYWDALSDDALDWLNSHTGAAARRSGSRRTRPRGSTSARPAGSGPGSLPDDPGPSAWYVVQNRPGAFCPLDSPCSCAARPASRPGREVGGAAGLGLPPLTGHGDPPIGPLTARRRLSPGSRPCPSHRERRGRSIANRRSLEGLPRPCESARSGPYITSSRKASSLDYERMALNRASTGSHQTLSGELPRHLHPRVRLGPALHHPRLDPVGPVPHPMIRDRPQRRRHQHARRPPVAARPARPGTPPASASPPGSSAAAAARRAAAPPRPSRPRTRLYASRWAEELLADHRRRLAPQHVHPHRLLDATGCPVPHATSAVEPGQLAGAGTPPASSRLVTTTNDRVRNPGLSTRTRSSRIGSARGSAANSSRLIHSGRLRSPVPLDQVVLAAQPRAAAEVGPAAAGLPHHHVDAHRPASVTTSSNEL